MPCSQHQGSAVRCLSLVAMFTAVLAAAARADEPVVWTNVAGASASGNTLTKTTTADAWDAGGASVNVIRDGTGYVEFTAVETNTYRMAGLAYGDTNQDSADVDFGILVGANQDLYVFEGGNYRGYFGSYASGDRFRVEVDYGIVRYTDPDKAPPTPSPAPQPTPEPEPDPQMVDFCQKYPALCDPSNACEKNPVKCGFVVVAAAVGFLVVWACRGQTAATP